VERQTVSASTACALSPHLSLRFVLNETFLFIIKCILSVVFLFLFLARHMSSTEDIKLPMAMVTEFNGR